MRRFSSIFFDRVGAKFAAVLGLGVAAVLIPMQPVFAASVTLTNGSSCTYSLVAGDPSGNFTFTCLSSSAPGSLAFTSSTASVASSGTMSVSVVRAGGTSGAVSATLNVTAGSCTLDQSTVSFASGFTSATPASVTLTAPPTAGTCTITITPAGGATAGSPSTLNVSVVDPNANVTFTFSTATSTAFFGGSSIPITVTRSGGTNGAWNVPFTLGGTMTASGALVTGGGSITPANGMLQFAANSQSAQISYSPPASAPTGVTPPATVTYLLGVPTASGTPVVGQGASIGATATNTMSVQVPAGPCATTATVTQAYVSGSTPYGPLGPGQNAAVSIPITSAMLGRLVKTSLVETTSTESGADVQFAISACPGDFAKPFPCTTHTQYTGGLLNFTIGPKPAGTPWYMNVCELPVGTTTVYFNFRYILRPSPTPQDASGTPSCMGKCGSYVQVN